MDWNVVVSKPLGDTGKSSPSNHHTDLSLTKNTVDSLKLAFAGVALIALVTVFSCLTEARHAYEEIKNYNKKWGYVPKLLRWDQRLKMQWDHFEKMVFSAYHALTKVSWESSATKTSFPKRPNSTCTYKISLGAKMSSLW